MQQIPKHRIIVIGSGEVGEHFVEQLARHDSNKRFEVLVFEALPMGNAKRSGVATVVEKERVVAIDRQRRQVTTDFGRVLSYEKLVLETGAVLSVPRIEGDEKQNVFVCRSEEDIVAVTASASVCKRATIYGGGPLGIEAAKVCADAGDATTLLESGTELLSGLKENESGTLRRMIESMGIRVRFDTDVKSIGGQSAASSVRLIGDSMIPTDMVVLTAKRCPNTQLAKEAGLDLNESGTIAVGTNLKTSDPNIYAIGECAGVDGVSYSTREDGYTMATVLVCQLIGKPALFSRMSRESGLRCMLPLQSREKREPALQRPSVAVSA